MKKVLMLLLVMLLLPMFGFADEVHLTDNAQGIVAVDLINLTAGAPAVEICQVQSVDQQENQRGCCSWHGGVSHCGPNLSRSC